MDELNTPPEQIISLSVEEWMDISQQLEQHHALFYQCWQMGRPIFTDAIATAAVRFNPEGEFLEFLFNPDFWASQTPYERLFIIAHECLHVALNHGVRTRNQTDPDATNAVLDIVVNHTLVNNFGFDRSLIRDNANLCWVDTVFPDKPDMPTDQSFEFYYNQLPVVPADVFILDVHDMLAGGGSGMGGVIGKLNRELTEEEKESIKNVLEKHAPPEGGGLGGAPAGVGEGGWTFAKVGHAAPKKKWESVIKEWSLKRLRDDQQDVEQWARIHRRFTLMPNDLMLPSEMEEDAFEKDRLPVFFFLDTSGSCWGLRDRFFQAAMSLPKERFDIRLFCFDTKVHETTLESKKIYGGGGTAFNIIEEKIQRLVRDECLEYPEAVFIITDGMGTPVSPQRPEKWYWFLTPYNSKGLIPAKSKTFMLRDYE